MIVNKYINGGGGGSGERGPQGPQGPQGSEGAQGFKIELSTNNPEEFTNDDTDELDAFGAAFEEDNSIAEGAYILIDGYKYSFNSYEEGEGTIIMYFEQLTSIYVDELVITFDSGTYVSAESNYTNIGEQPAVDVTKLSPVSEFPQEAYDGDVVALVSEVSGNGVYQYDGTDWVNVGGQPAGDNTILKSVSAAPATMGLNDVAVLGSNLSQFTGYEDVVSAYTLVRMYNGSFAKDAGENNIVNVTANEQIFSLCGSYISTPLGNITPGSEVYTDWTEVTDFTGASTGIMMKYDAGNDELDLRVAAGLSVEGEVVNKSGAELGDLSSYVETTSVEEHFQGGPIYEQYAKMGDLSILKHSDTIPQNTEHSDVFSFVGNYPDVTFSAWTDNGVNDVWWSATGGDRAVKLETLSNTRFAVVIENTWYVLRYNSGSLVNTGDVSACDIKEYSEKKWILSDNRYTFFVEVSDAIYVYTLFSKGFHHFESPEGVNIISTNNLTINEEYYEEGAYRTSIEQFEVGTGVSPTGSNRVVQTRITGTPVHDVFCGSATDTSGNTYEVWLAAGGNSAWINISGSTEKTTVNLGSATNISGDGKMSFRFQFKNGTSFNTIILSGISSSNVFQKNLLANVYDTKTTNKKLAEDWEIPNETRLVPVADGNGKFLLSHTTDGSYWESITIPSAEYFGETDSTYLDGIYTSLNNTGGRVFDDIGYKRYFMDKSQIDMANGKYYKAQIELKPISTKYDVDNDTWMLNFKCDWTLSGDEMTITMKQFYNEQTQDYEMMFCNTASTAGNCVLFAGAASYDAQATTSIVDSAGTVIFASEYVESELSVSAATGISYVDNGEGSMAIEGFEAGQTYTWSFNGYNGEDVSQDTFVYRVPQQLH